MTHDSVKPFRCTKLGCQKSYCDVRSLRRHLEIAHSISIDTSDDGDMLMMNSSASSDVVPGTALEVGDILSTSLGSVGMPRYVIDQEWRSMNCLYIIL